MHVYTLLSELSVFDSWGDMTLSYWLTGMFSAVGIWYGFHNNADNQPKYFSLFRRWS